MDRDWLYEIDDYGETALTRISKSGRMDLANVLFLQRIEDAVKEVAHAPEIHRAAYWGYADAIEALIAEGANVDEVDQQGERPLHKAVRHNHVEAVKALLDAGAEVNAPNQLGLTPLHWAALRGLDEIAELLLEHGANPYIRDWVTGGLMARDFARLMGYDYLQAILARSMAVI